MTELADHRSSMQTTARCRIFGAALLALMTVPGAKAQDANQELATATAQIRAGQYDAALEGIGTALRVHPTDPRLRTVEGLAYSLKGDDAHALLCLRAALRIDPRFPSALKAEGADPHARAQPGSFLGAAQNSAGQP